MNIGSGNIIDDKTAGVRHEVRPPFLGFDINKASLSLAFQNCQGKVADVLWVKIIRRWGADFNSHLRKSASSADRVLEWRAGVSFL
jgi:hypothetical protein